MKKALYAVGLLAIVAGTTVTIQSCNKIKDEIAKQINPINFSQQNITFTLPAMSGTDTVQTQAVNVPINLEQLIMDKKPKDVSVGYNMVKSIKIKKITLTLVEGQSATSNWTNFEGVFFSANTNIGKTKNLPNQGVWVGISDETSWQFTPVELEFPAPQNNLKDYFDASGNANAEYYLQGSMRRSTNEMKVNAVVDYELGFQ